MRFLRLIYILAFLFLLVAASVTAYGLSHPELGLVEADPIVRVYISEYDPIVSLLNQGILLVVFLVLCYDLCLMSLPLLSSYITNL